MAPPQKGGLEIEMTHSVKYEYLKYGNWDRVEILTFVHSTI